MEIPKPPENYLSGHAWSPDDDIWLERAKALTEELWVEPEQSGFLSKLMPIINIVMLFVIMLLIFFKR